MEVNEGDWVLVDGKDIAKVYREDHFGDTGHAFIQYWYEDSLAIHQTYINKKRLTVLDSALNVLFERNKNA